jgi:hypothetical protein
MNKTASFGLIFFYSLLAHSYSLDSKSPMHWVCYSQGTQSNSGYPPGPIYLIVRGEGCTENEAIIAAQENCFDQGLVMCRVIQCHTK